MRARNGEKKIKSEPRDLVSYANWLARAFDELWAEMDRSYSYFFLKKDIDWKQLREEYRPRVLRVSSLKEFVSLLQEMLSKLRDMHVWIERRGKVIGTYRTPWKRNFNVEASLARLAEKSRIGRFAVVGTTRDDGFGYLLILRQSSATKELVRQTVMQIRKRRSARGFIVDLRAGCNGGDERLAREIARVFCGQKTVYAKSKYRNGPRYESFGPVHERKLKPSIRPYTKPVLCLIGQGCISSGEGLVKMMQCLPQITTMGERTRGISGNPKPFQLKRLGISVWFSRWVDMSRNGVPFEGRGIAPDVAIKLPLEAFKNADLILEKAIRLLRRRSANL